MAPVPRIVKVSSLRAWKYLDRGAGGLACKGLLVSLIEASESPIWARASSSPARLGWRLCTSD